MDDSKLIFLISQPRSGSSMVQQLILSESRIASSPEPWQMLSLISTYTHHDIRVGYNPRFAAINFNRYLDSLENGKESFKNTIKEMALDLYGSRSQGLPYYLDKTPRYYHIIDELIDLFPTAKIILLVRNPLSVFASMLDYNFKGDVVRFLNADDRLDDLLLAPEKILNASKEYSNLLHITYEDVVDRPQQSLHDVYTYLGFDLPENINYKLREEFKDSTAVDNKSLQRHDQPVKDYLSGWKKSIDTSQKKIAAMGYLEELKDRIPNYFGYDLDLQIQELQKLEPSKRNNFNLSFRLLSTKEEKLSTLDLLRKRVYLKLQNTFSK